MEIVCAWCKKHMGRKEPLEDKSISHTICRECSIKFLGIDPVTGERVKQDTRRNPMATGMEKLANGERVSKLKPKRITGMEDWKLYMSTRSQKETAYERAHARRSGWHTKVVFDKYAGQWLIWVTTRKNPGASYHFDKVQDIDEILDRKDIGDTMRAMYKGSREAHHASYWESKRLNMNPATSERQRKFMCAELGRFRAGKRTRTGMSERSLRDFCRKLKRARKNPAMPGEQAVWKRVVKETAEYLRKAGYDKDSAYVSIFNRLRGVPDELIRSSINEAYRMGKNRHRSRR